MIPFKHHSETPGRGRRPRLPVGLVSAALSVSALCGWGCNASGTIRVKSHPPGARVLVDGEDSGLRTPARLEVSTLQKELVVRVEKPGFNPVSRTVRYTTEVDPITPSEAAGTIICSPCCLGLPLLSFLEPLKVESSFVPSRIEVHLDPAGQGLRIDVTPRDAEVLVDGVRGKAIVSNLYSLAVGEREVDVRAEGYHPFTRRVDVQQEMYQDLSIHLRPEGEGLIVRRPHGVPTSPGELRILVDGVVHETVFDRPVRLIPGTYEVEIAGPGLEPWKSTVRVSKDGYLEIRPALSPRRAHEDASSSAQTGDEERRDS